MIARGRLNRLMLVPALLIAAGLLAVVLYPRLSPDRLAYDCPSPEGATAPSGRTLTFCEAVYETQDAGLAPWVVVRVIDAGLPETEDIVDAADHDWACARWGQAAAGLLGQVPERIVVQIMAEPFPRGTPAPGIRQAIEAYSLQDGACVWELF